MRNMLEDKGFRQILCEGGPSLLGSLLAAGVVDELDLTWSPIIVGGEHPAIVNGPQLEPAGLPDAPARGGRHHPRPLVRQPLTARAAGSRRCAPSGADELRHRALPALGVDVPLLGVPRACPTAPSSRGRAAPPPAPATGPPGRTRRRPSGSAGCGAPARRPAPPSWSSPRPPGRARPRAAAPTAVPSGPGSARRWEPGMPLASRVVRDHVAPVDHRRVEHHVGDVVGEPGAARGSAARWRRPSTSPTRTSSRAPRCTACSPASSMSRHSERPRL